MTFFQQLRRRKVFRSAIAYLAGVWLVLQVAETTLPYLGAPEWVMRALIYASVLGLPFVLILSWKYDLTREGLQPTDSQLDDVAPVKTSRRLDILIYTIMSIAIVVLVVDNYLLDQSVPDDRRSIAVLPLDNLTPGPENDSFAGGMHDEILSSLASIASLKVISRTSVLAYRDSTKNVREIGRELGVATILEGTVRRAADTVRIDVQLIDAETDEQIWSQAYNRELSVADMLAIQADIARTVSDALRAELTPGENDRLDVLPTENLQAYEAYLAGMNLMSAGRSDYLDLAMQQFEKAVEADPDFALAWIALADVHAYLSLYLYEEADARRQVALDALARADALQAGLPQSEIVRGRLAALEGDHQAAIRYLSSAEQALPGDARLHREKGRAYQRVMQLEEAIESYERAVSLDPRDPVARVWLADTFGKLRMYDRAEAHAQTSLDFNPECDYCRRRVGEMRQFRGDDPDRVLEVLPGPRGLDEETSIPIFQAVFDAHVMNRDYRQARAALDAWWPLEGDEMPEPHFPNFRAFIVALESGPEAAAGMYRDMLEKSESEPAENLDLLRRLTLAEVAGEAHAWLGNREAAVAAARRVLSGELLHYGPEWDFWTSETVVLPTMIYILASAKDKDLLLATLDDYLSSPGNWSIEAFSRHPVFDFLHDDPGWQEIYEKYRR